jgi:hypothetical protein
MSKQFQDDLKDLLEISYSPQHTEWLALNKAEGWNEHQMAILDKKFPLVNDQALLWDTVAGQLVVRIDAGVQKKQGGSGKSKACGRSTTCSSSRTGGALTQSISGSQSGSGISQAFSQTMT